MKKGPIIVSAFILNVNNRKDLNLDKYLENGKKLINLKINKIIFFDEKLYKTLDITQYTNNYTTLIPSKKSDIYLYQYQDKIVNFDTIIRNQEKDTIDFMFLMCNKTEYMRKAIEITRDTKKQYIWVDFGIGYIFKTNYKYESLFDCFNKIYDGIRIPSIWNPRINRGDFIYKRVI